MFEFLCNEIRILKYREKLEKISVKERLMPKMHEKYVKN
jgi:hypothetical protein